MANLTADCPRCNSQKITFNVRDLIFTGLRHNWQKWYEAFCICQQCLRSTVFVLYDRNGSKAKTLRNNGLLSSHNNLNEALYIHERVSPQDNPAISIPENIPEKIKTVLIEGELCMATGCYSAASTIFRLCIELAIRDKFPSRTKQNMACGKETDDVISKTLQQEDAESLHRFTVVLLKSIYSGKTQ
jgi:hypothetical protein